MDNTQDTCNIVYNNTYKFILLDIKFNQSNCWILYFLLVDHIYIIKTSKYLDASIYRYKKQQLN